MNETQKANERLLTALKIKPKIPWDTTIASLLATVKGAQCPSISIIKQAISRACLDPTIPKSIMKLLLRQVNTDIATTTIEDRVNWILEAIRCENSIAVQQLLQDSDYQEELLQWQEITRSRNSLFHLACGYYGWNNEIAFILDVTRLQNIDGHGSYHTLRTHGEESILRI